MRSATYPDDQLQQGLISEHHHSGATPAYRHAIEKPRLRVAVFLENLPDTGGGFLQALSTIEKLTKENVTRHQFVVFTTFEQSRRRLLAHGIEATALIVAQI